MIGGTTSGSVVEAGGVANATAGTPTATGTLTATDVDNPANTFQAVAAGAASTGAYGTYGVTAGGVWTYTLDNSLAATQALKEGDSVTQTYTARVTDDKGAYVDQTITLTLTGSNDVPVITNSVAATQGSVTEAGHLDDGSEPVAGSVGRCLPWHPVHAIEVDAQNNLVRICEPGERGVLVIGGPNVTPGYVDPSLDDEFFVKGMPGNLRWANTGDLGTVDANGFIWLFGRAKDVIIRGGHNIDPKMIEEVLVCHPSVQVAAAIGRPDSSKGEMPTAYVQLKEGHSATREELLALCKERVQERAAVPVDIIALPQIPMTAVGKINKPALRLITMRQIAIEEATRILDGCGSCEVSIDETGKRPTVQIVATVPADRVAELEGQLKNRFRDYEFLTVLEMRVAH